MSHVAPRIVNHVSYVRGFNHESDFLRQTVVGGSRCSAQLK